MWLMKKSGMFDIVTRYAGKVLRWKMAATWHQHFPLLCVNCLEDSSLNLAYEWNLICLVSGDKEVWYMRDL